MMCFPSTGLQAVVVVTADQLDFFQVSWEGKQEKYEKKIIMEQVNPTPSMAFPSISVVNISKFFDHHIFQHGALSGITSWVSPQWNDLGKCLACRLGNILATGLSTMNCIEVDF